MQRSLSVKPVAPMTAKEAKAAAAGDPDALHTSEESAKVRQTPRAKTLRRALGLTLR
jgi:hypothetical protein